MTDADGPDPTAGAGPAAEAPDRMETARAALLDALPAHVAFDGWSWEAIRLSAEDAGVGPELARAIFPRGGIDAALAFHRRGDRLLAERMAAAPLGSMRIREKVAFGVRTRLELVEEAREAVRRGATLTALPIHAADGARMVWETADTIWTALGDSSEDLNWYTKRAILSGVYGSTVLYWLGDETPGRVDTWAFLDRRIEGVMQFEKVKAQVNANPLGRLVFAGPMKVAEMIRAPRSRRDGAPAETPGGY